jgi:hypothetical protein
VYGAGDARCDGEKGVFMPWEKSLIPRFVGIRHFWLEIAKILIPALVG